MAVDTNPYANIPELDVKARENERRRKIAEAMFEQGNTPVQPFTQAGGVVIPMHWAQGLAQMAKAYVAKKGLQKADKADTALAQQLQQGQAQAVKDYLAKSQGAPEVPAAAAQGPQGPMPSVGPPQPAVQANPRQAVLDLLANKYAPPQVVQGAILGENWRREDAQSATAAEDKRNALRDTLEQRDREYKEKIASQERLGADANELKRMQIENQRQLQALIHGQSGLPKPPTGYRYKEDGTQEPIPGGPADLKIKAQAAKENEAHKTALRVLNAEIDNVNQLIGSPDGKIKPHPGLAAMTGSIDARTPTIFQDTANAEALLESLQSKASINALRDIRAGGSQSIGQITEREWPRLESMKATLQKKQGDEQFPKSLAAYRDELLQTKRELDSALSGADLGAQPVGTPSSGMTMKFDAQGNPIQ